MILTYSNGIDKATFVSEMEAHRAADRIVQGTYGNYAGACAVGCGVRTINAWLGRQILENDHDALADALGWPLWLVRMEDPIFEGLPYPNYRDWPVDLARAVPEGVDLSPALGRVMSRILREVALSVAGASAAVVKRVARGWETHWSDDCAAAAAQEAARVARVAAGWAEAAECPARQAKAARAAKAAKAAEAAARSAEAAEVAEAWSAEAAAWATMADTSAGSSRRACVRVALILVEEVARCEAHAEAM